MRAVICGANGAMGKLICGILGDEVAGKVSIDGENGVPKTFDELGAVEAERGKAKKRFQRKRKLRFGDSL